MSAADWRQQQELEEEQQFIEQEKAMSVYKKLQEARVRLQGMELKKSGRNTFAGYEYFELGDFLLPTQMIFSELGLCGVVSFTADIATLKVVDIDTSETIEFTSPMGSAALKGCHEVQNIGAVETYQRRYLWVAAMEIVEHDALDATNGKDKEADRERAAAKEAKEKAERDAMEKTLLAQAKKASGKGVEEYKKFWSELNPAQKQIIGPNRHTDFKIAAEDLATQP